MLACRREELDTSSLWSRPAFRHRPRPAVCKSASQQVRPQPASDDGALLHAAAAYLGTLRRHQCIQSYRHGTPATLTNLTMPPQEPPSTAAVIETSDVTDAGVADYKAAFHVDVGSVTKTTLTSDEAERAVESLCKFVTYETVSATAPTTGAYVECAKYIVSELEGLGFLGDVHLLPEAPDHSPVVVAKWTGKDDSLPIVLLNSHYDVVPAAVEDWTVEPFAGIRRGGRIYGRGTQDMKCVCIQYIEALRKLHAVQPDYQPTRSIYLTFVPDEEIGGSGMAAFLSSALYKSLPGIAIALDEGLASETDTYSVFYGERLPWWVDVTATGNTGHGSRFIDNTAVEQLVELANRALAFRKGQRDALHGADHSDHSNCSHAVAAKNRRLAKERAGQKMQMSQHHHSPGWSEGRRPIRLQLCSAYGHGQLGHSYQPPR